MKVSNLPIWQFIAILIAVLVVTSLAFRFVEKKIYQKKMKKNADVPLPQNTDGTTGIDTSNGLVYRQ